ncbi:MAG: hypothetical protein AB1324_02905 [Candidatus Micrarchaeota archaeon]
MSRGNGGRTKFKYREGEVKLTQTGIGKDYSGFRIFHTRKSDRLERIGNDYSLSEPSDEELRAFRDDLAKAARKDAKIARYLDEFPRLKIRAETEALKPEPDNLREE